MLAVDALEDLSRKLATAIGAMGIHSGEFGKSDLVEKPVREAERIFQGYAKAKPSKEDAYAAARAFLRGGTIDSWQKDLVASAIAEPIREQSGAMVLGHPRFSGLLAEYEAEAKRGDLWRLTWHGLLYAYFNFDPDLAKDDATHQGWSELRSFLERTWPLIDRQAGNAVVPDWVNVLRNESEVITNKPADKYASDYLRGDTEATERLAADLGISPSSWFWHALVLGAVRRATAESDVEFRRLISQLIKLIQDKPRFRDDAIELILVRYHKCSGAPQDERLRDYVCLPTVWKNPKLKAAGIATAWNRVPDPVWRMVLNWVNEDNLKAFFDILAARNQADEGRLAFWSKYMKQIEWTRLVFSADTMLLKRSNPEIRDLIAREEGAYAQLTGKREVDAFMMQIGAYVVIEFSKKPNACYVYKEDELPFEPYERYYAGGSADLAAGYQQGCAARIVHNAGWAMRAAEQLRDLEIYPDRPEAKRVFSSRATSTNSASTHTQGRGTSTLTNKTSGPDMRALQNFVRQFQGASIDDRRNAMNGGRLWVEDPQQRVQFGTELKALGFKWANSRQAWYYPEN